MFNNVPYFLALIAAIVGSLVSSQLTKSAIQGIIERVSSCHLYNPDWPDSSISSAN